MGTYILTPELREKLKSPQGLLITGESQRVVDEIGKIIDTLRPRRVISVGDVISKSMLDVGLKVDVFIVDNKSMRRATEPIKYEARKTFHLVNLAGTISEEAWRVIREAIDSDGPVKILVEGEEDLLTIVAVLLAPENSIVVYGQPNEGAVVIIVDKYSKERMHKIISEMEYKDGKLM